MSLISWLLFMAVGVLLAVFGRRPVEDYVPNWTPVRAEQAWRDTERMLLGACGRKRIVGDRVVEERNRRVEAMRARPARQLRMVR
jgi:hypothetical protein